MAPAAAMAVALVASARPSAASPPDDGALAECRAVRPHQAARACLLRAHSARPQIGALCELGRLEETAGQPVEAYEAYRRCLKESTGAPAGEALRQARARVAHLETRLALLLVRADQPGAVVSVGGQPRGAVGRGPIAIRPGSHRLQVDSPGFRPWRDIVTGTAGEMIEVRAQLAKDAGRRPGPAPRPGRSAAGARVASVVQVGLPPADAGEALEAEILLERALDAEEAQAAAERAAAWCDLAVLEGHNPHRERAHGRCTKLQRDGAERARRRATMLAEQRVLLSYLGLRRKGETAKLAAVEKFLRTFGALRGERAHTEAVLTILGGVPESLRRRICDRAGVDRLPTVKVTVTPMNERGAALAGRVFVDGRVVGSAPGTYAVPVCADRIGIGLGDGPATWERPLPRDPRGAEVQALFRRFVASPDTVQDTMTGRAWQRRATGEPLTFANAQRYCERLVGVGWRLPTEKELRGLVERRGPPTIDSEAFLGTRAEAYWTATAHPSQRYHVWVVSFGSGQASGRFVGQEAHARCVK